jgi:hypothetical protein
MRGLGYINRKCDYTLFYISKVGVKCIAFGVLLKVLGMSDVFEIVMK